MSLSVDVTHRFGAFVLEARFVSEGRLTAFFGRSGSGKTSLVNIIAGIVRPDRRAAVRLRVDKPFRLQDEQCFPNGRPADSELERELLLLEPLTG